MPEYQTTVATASSTAYSSRASSVQSDRHHESAQHLRPEDAFYHSSPPPPHLGRSDTVTASSSRNKRRGRSSRRRRQNNPALPPRANGQWKKLLWVKQSYPDNYTDEETFLDHLQRNPRLRPYEFWPLVADSTIILQHVCSVVVFVCCFTGIFEGRVRPEVVVGWGTLCTVGGWVGREFWGAEGDGQLEAGEQEEGLGAEEADFGMPFKEQNYTPLATSAVHSRNPSASSLGAKSSTSFTHEHTPSLSDTSASFPSLPGRLTSHLKTLKSALLIYFSLLGLSPILKSLTRSTSSDSIWALASWLLCLNVFTFDYGAGPEAKFPASLSTNAALMASTVLASRLPTTTHVFSLTLFSIEVFGLFPVFRRHLRFSWWAGHLWLTGALVVLASGGLSMVISGGSWGMGMVGVALGALVCCAGMGATTWWLIGLQRYKNEIHGPWDPARPIIRGHWD